jgi:hypothetical protein
MIEKRKESGMIDDIGYWNYTILSFKDDFEYFSQHIHVGYQCEELKS